MIAPIIAAHNSGWRAGAAGAPPEVNPYHKRKQPIKHRAWKAGHFKGMKHGLQMWLKSIINK